MNRLTRIISLALVLAVVAGTVAFSAGQTEEGTTVIDIPRQPRVFIAPGNPEAAHTQLQLNPEVAPAPDSIILAYELVVFDSGGNEIWSQMEEVTETRGFFGNLFNIGERPQIDPNVIRGLTWDGRDNDGALVDDGDYIYQLFVTDDDGRTFRTPPQNLTVDNQPPTISQIDADYRIFSPGITGQREELPIRQDGSLEVSWVGRFLNEGGEVVREYTWENPIQYDPTQPRQQNLAGDRRPEDFRWDGRDEAGDYVPDGTYTYELTGMDRPGNQVSQSVTDIRVATEEGDVTVTPSRAAFSPEGPSPQVAFGLAYDEVLDVVEWELRVLDADTEQVEFRRFSGDGTPPGSISWDGTDEGGTVVADDTYHVVFAVTYENGVEARSLATPVIVDTVAPQATVNVSPEVFGGETRPTLLVDADWDTDASWEAIVSVDGAEFELELDGLIEQFGVTPAMLPIEWAGDDIDGELFPDGIYTGILRGTDLADNVGESNMVSFVIDRRDTPIDIELSADIVSPDFRGINDEVLIRPILEVTDRIELIRAVVRTLDGEAVRTFEADQAIDSFSWDGRNEQNQPVAAGDYEVELQVYYENGNQPTAVSGPVAVDRDAPQLTLEIPYNAFAPNDDGYRDTLPVSIMPQETEGIISWMAVVEDADGEVVRSIAGDGVPPDEIEWDGRDDLGNILDGYYRVGMRILYDGGGEIEQFVEGDVLVDAAGPDIEISATPIPYSPEFNGEERDLEITLSAADEWSELLDWRLELLDPEGNVVLSFEEEGTPPEEVTWDGVLEDGEMVLSAVEYVARFTVRDELRNESIEELGVLTDIIVREENGRLRIIVPSIEFEPNRSYLFAAINERLQRNLSTLRSLARVLNQFDDRDIIIEGHANHTRFATQQQIDNEQRDFLLPLSRARAITVRDALAILDVSLDRMSVRAIGGARPIVPFDDFDNTWQNRRVEFLLDRND